jgi:hypothetical protein
VIAHTALPLLSASQIDLFRGCPRKWAFRYIVGIKPPKHPKAALGDEVEGQINRYLLTGEPFVYGLESESGEIAAPSLAYLPPPKTLGMRLQKHFAFERIREPLFAYQGYLDLWLPDSRMLPEIPPFPSVIPGVVDFKTTRSLRYTKTAKVLKVDVQANLYAFIAMRETGARTCDLVWITMQTEGTHKAKRTHLRVTAGDVVEQYDAIHATAEAIARTQNAGPSRDDEEAARLEYTLSLPPNVAMCAEFGGCPYRSQCNVSPAESRESILRTCAEERKKDAMSNAPAPVDAIARLKARRAGAKAPAPAPEPPSPTPSVMGCADVDVPAPTELPAWAVNPPESKLPPAPPIGTAAPASTTTEEGSKRGRGRPPGSKNKPKDPVVDPPVGLEAPLTPTLPSAPAKPEAVVDALLDESADRRIRLVVAGLLEDIAHDIRERIASERREAS